MKKETEEWIKIAGEDYVSAKCLFGEELYRMVCCHSQQVVEKVLKAFLVEEGVDFARTHNLIDLKNGVIRFGYKIAITNEDLIFLNSVYRSRYPSDLGLLPSGEPTKEDAQKSLDIAGAIVGYVQIVKSKGPKNNK